MDILNPGNKGLKVQFLQRLLNKALARDGVESTMCSEDGHFGNLTYLAVKAFQTRHNLKSDGSVGPNTWSALGFKYAKEHSRVIRFPQTTDTSCWSAAATQILGNQVVGPGLGTLDADGTLNPTLENVQAFATGLGWTMLNFSPSADDLVRYLMQKPLWIGVTEQNSKHAVTFSAVYSDGDPEGDGTLVRIHDPWPVARGTIYGTFCDPLMIGDGSFAARGPALSIVVLIPY